MHTQQRDASVSNLTSAYLHSLNVAQLRDLLAHTNKLFTVALISGIKFREYINSLKNEMEMIQAVIDCKRQPMIA